MRSAFIMGLLATAVLASEVLIHEIEASGFQESGASLYYKYCSSCHGKEREGVSAPPLLPSFLKGIDDRRLEGIIRNSLPQTLMPKFDFLSKEQIDKLIAYLRTPATQLRWDREQIRNSKEFFDLPTRELGIKSIENVTMVVERGADRIWVMEDERILDRFPFANVHGGLKFTPAGERCYIPTRDGWVGRYSLVKGGLEAKVRPCIALRNIALSRDGRYLFATCLLPKRVVVLDPEHLDPVKLFPVEGKISALYELYTQDRALFTLRDKPWLYLVDTKRLTFSKIPLEQPIEDFFIDPFEEYLVGTARSGKRLAVYRLDGFKEVFHASIPGMPHLFSATFWYKDGHFYFATPHLRSSSVTIWQMYDWKLVREVDVGGDGFFVKTHPATSYLWVDNGSDQLVLIDKGNYSIKTLVPRRGKRYLHAEFSGDGRYAYLSIYEPDGDLLVWRGDTFREVRDYKANVPVGKYNFVNKNRRFYPRLFGQALFQEKCWGCHHEESMAFGPPLRQIAAKRSDDEIIAQILDPEHTSKLLGYKRNAMPAFPLSPKELESILAYIRSGR
ncbi:MAG: cytochrome C [Nitratiruptor sp.]|nr:cytochrome C [Nitratiruptor sp.]NPA83519.1 c-type cytochrome [Campylobacterota bacterium]